MNFDEVIIQLRNTFQISIAQFRSFVDYVLVLIIAIKESEARLMQITMRECRMVGGSNLKSHSCCRARLLAYGRS